MRRFRGTTPASASTRATSTFPQNNAATSGVPPSPRPNAETGAPAASNTAAIAGRFEYAAWCNAVHPCALPCRTSAPRDTSNATNRSSHVADASPSRSFPFEPCAVTNAGNLSSNAANPSASCARSDRNARANGESDSSATCRRSAAHDANPWLRATTNRAPAGVNGADQRPNEATADGVPSEADASNPSARSA